MDEPTARLASPNRKSVELVSSLRTQGIAIIIISHQMYDVFSVADRIIVMRRGIKAGERLVKNTTSEEIVSLIVGAESVEKRSQ